MQKRIEWIDRAKTLGIFLVILGHFLSQEDQEGILRKSIYLFHMPLFFFISGYLFHVKENNFRSFLSNNFKSLIIPYITLNVIALFFLLPYYIIQEIDLKNLFYYFIIGHCDAPAGPAWFLLSLFWVRIYSYFYQKHFTQFNIFTLIISFFIGYIPILLYGTIGTFGGLKSSLMALPLFLLGCYAKKHKAEKYIDNNFIIILFLVISPFILIYYGIIQGQTSILFTTYGEKYFLYYILAIIGILQTVIISIKFRFYTNLVKTISSGTILIMGLHLCVVNYLNIVFENLCLNPAESISYKFIISAIIAIMFYYPIQFFKNNFTFIIGGRK
jgi:acyltransferase